MDDPRSDFPAAEAAEHFPELLARAEAGEEIVIRRDGRPVARLSPMPSLSSQELTPDQRLQAHREWISWRKAHGPRLAPGETVKDLIEEGRRI